MAKPAFWFLRGIPALAAALCALLAHPERACAMGQAGYQRSRDLFTWEAVGARLQSEIALLQPD